MLYDKVWPCVLIDKNVHKHISMILSTKLPTEIFNIRKSNVVMNQQEKMEQIQALQDCYISLYSGNTVFQKIAANVINDLKI